jgi:IS4 transposase
LTNFEVKETDLFLGDRAYGTKTSMEHCLAGKGNFIFRIRRNAFDIYDKYNNKIDLIEKLKKLRKNKTLRLRCGFLDSSGNLVPIRICAMHKPKDVNESPEDDTDFMNNYIVLATSILDNRVSAKDILELYRLRWQIELYFKRLKSLMSFGDVPNKTEEHIKIWLNAKLAVAIMLEIMTAQVDFSPTGTRCE